MNQPANRYLFLCTIGPVQEFIMSARRARDLWYGSWMLSELSRAAAKAVHDPEKNLIFPAPDVVSKTADDQNEPASVANKIVAIIETDNITEEGKRIKQAVSDRLLELRESAFTSVKDWSMGDLELAKQQVEALLECYWAAVPYDQTADYSTQRALLEQVMAARKTTRQFTHVQLSAEQQRYPKSSLDGQRESVIYESAYPERGDDETKRRNKLQTLFTKFGAKQAERLSGVDLLKRRGNHRADEADFPSTSHFAAIPFIQKLLENKGEDQVRNAFRAYRMQLETLISQNRMVHLEKLDERYRVAFPVLENYDASILYMSRLAEEIDAKDEETRKSAEQLLQAFLAIAARKTRTSSEQMLRTLPIAANIATPQAYYALLQADGDSMGKVIDNQKTVEEHRALSQQLALFATEARRIVEGEEHKGTLIYSGGDDVLALLPVNSALRCAQALHRRFDELVGIEQRCASCKKPQFVDETNRSPTLSVGIAICHHLEPLNDALALVRKAEKAAKQINGKNALAIAIDKRSGEPQMIAGSWSDASGFFTRLQNWLRLMQDDELSAGAPYELRDLTERLAEPQELNQAHQTHHLRAVAEEAGRIIERKRGQRGNQKVSDDDIAHLREWLGLPEKKKENDVTKIIIQANGERYREQKLTVRQLSDELIVARELVRFGAQPIEIQKGTQS